jgi:predicted NAD/FAD-dependent oxidoreductase
MLGLVGGQAQWVFDRGLLCGQAGLLASVISAHIPFHDSQEILAMQIATEVKSMYPQCDNLIWHKVITEKRATFSCDADLKRPHAELSGNVYLAGDYVQGNYPATIEGAVRSGIFSAKQIIEKGK